MAMEDLKLIMDDIMINRNNIAKLADLTVETAEKHNRLCKNFKYLCFVCLGLDLLILWNAIDISKLKKELKEKENKEG